MAPKEYAVLFELLQLVEARFALRVIHALADGKPQTFRFLQDSVGGATPNTLNARTKELRAAGLLAHGKQGYFLTSLGLELAALMVQWPALAARWQAATKAATPSLAMVHPGLVSPIR